MISEVFFLPQILKEIEFTFLYESDNYIFFEKCTLSMALLKSTKEKKLVPNMRDITDAKQIWLK